MAKKPIKIVIISAAGFAEEVLFAIQECNKIYDKYEMLGFIDDNKKFHGKMINGFPVLGGLEWIGKNSSEIRYVIAIGDGLIRKKIIKKLNKKIKFETIIHPTVLRYNVSSVGIGSVIQPHCIIEPNAKIGKHVIINIQCNIGHDCVLEDFVTIQPDVHISGNNKVGEETYVGVSSTTIENLSIGKKSVIGAGSVVLNDIKPNSVYIGNPAKFFKKIDIHNRPKL